MDFSVLPVFLATTLAVVLVPGPDMTLAIAVASRGPRQQLIQVVAGGSLGVIVWLSVAIAVLAGSDVLLLALVAPAVTAAQTAGGLYLVFLAIRLLRHPASSQPTSTVVAQPIQRPGSWFRRGLLVNLTNPKSLLFFLVLLPLFTGTASNTIGQMTMLGAILLLLGAASNLSAGIVTARVSARRKPHFDISRLVSQLSGALLLLLGLVAIVSAGATMGTIDGRLGGNADAAPTFKP